MNSVKLRVDDRTVDGERVRDFHLKINGEEMKDVIGVTVERSIDPDCSVVALSLWVDDLDVEVEGAEVHVYPQLKAGESEEPDKWTCTGCGITNDPDIEGRWTGSDCWRCGRSVIPEPAGV